MKWLIRNKTTGKFLKPSGDWSKDISTAMSFPDISAAITTEQRLGLSKVELVLQMLDYPSQYDVILPMGRVMA